MQTIETDVVRRRVGILGAALVMVASTTVVASASPCGPSGPGGPSIIPLIVPVQVETGSFAFGPGNGSFATSVNIPQFDPTRGTFGFATVEMNGSGRYRLPAVTLDDCANGPAGVGLAIHVRFANGVTVGFPAADLSAASSDDEIEGVTGSWSVATTAPQPWVVPSGTEIGVTIDAVFSPLDPQAGPVIDEFLVDGRMSLTVSYYYDEEAGSAGPLPTEGSVPAPGAAAILGLAACALAALRHREARPRPA